MNQPHNRAPEIHFKSFKLDSFDAETGEVSGYASKFHNIDQVGDRVEPGAFAKSIGNGASNVRFLWQHDRKEPIGVIKELREDEQGLYFKAQFAMTQRAQETRELMKMGAMDSFSIGYAVLIEEAKEIDNQKGSKRRINSLKELRLFEISAVTFPCNTEAKLAGIKSSLEGQFGDLTLDQQSVASKFMSWLVEQREKADEALPVEEPIQPEQPDELPKVEELEAALEQQEKLPAEQAPESVNTDAEQLKAIKQTLELRQLASALRRSRKG